MLAALRLEWIGEDTDRLMMSGLGRMLGGKAIRRPWVAQITGLDDRHGLTRQFLDGRIDYSHANSVGSRKVIVHYLLEEGGIYEIRSFQSWHRESRYFAQVREGEVVALSREEMMRALLQAMGIVP